MKRLAIMTALLVAGSFTLWAVSSTLWQQAEGAGSTGSYDIDIEVQSDVCDHDPYIFANPTGGEYPHNMKLQVKLTPGDPYYQITITGPPPWVTVTGEYDSDRGDVSGTGSGTVAGYQNVSVTFSGYFNHRPSVHTISGQYTFGAHNELPSGNCPDHQAHPAVYSVTMKPTPTPSPTGGVQPTEEVTATPTPQTPIAPTPTQPVPFVQGSCDFITSNSFYQGEQWDQWKCNPSTEGARYTRVDIYIGTSTNAAVFTSVHMVCQATHEKRAGVHKEVHTGFASPYAYLDVWSVEFEQKCVPGTGGGGISLYAQPNSGGHPRPVYNVIFTDQQSPTPTPTSVQPVESVTPTRTTAAPPETPTFTVTPTATLPLPNGSCDFVSHGVSFYGRTWDQWKCTPGPQVAPFNRVDIVLDRLLLGIDPYFVCQENALEAVGEIKSSQPEVWSAQFPQKCSTSGPSEGGVTVYLPEDQPQEHITGVAFTNVGPPAPTATPTSPRGGNGDCNGDGHTNSIDTAVVLQYDAGYLHTISPACDVNGDGLTDSRDGALILQFDAGLIHQLPVA